MARDKRISIGFEAAELDQIIERAKEAHLKLAAYIRWYLFKPIESARVHYQQQNSIPYMASKDIIERINKGGAVYIDPFQAAKLEAQATFKKSGSLGQLHNSIKLMARGGRILKNIPKKDLKNRKKWKEERKHIANKHLEEIKQKNIEAGILNNE